MSDYLNEKDRMLQLAGLYVDPLVEVDGVPVLESLAYATRAEKFANASDNDQLKLMYMWVKQSAIDFRDFRQLMGLYVQQRNER